MKNPLGVYEKALPKTTWENKFCIAQKLLFDFIELSIDESPERLARLNWNQTEINHINYLQTKYQMRIRSICFSGQRKYPFGSHDKQIREKSLELMNKCIILASKLGCSIIQLAGYDVYYEQKDQTTRKYFVKNLKLALQTASYYGVMLSVETMDDPFIKNLDDFVMIKKEIASPWFSVYPDIGNLSAWVGGSAQKVNQQLSNNKQFITGIHVKDTLLVTKDFAGKFKNVQFGEGCVPFVEIFQNLKNINYNGSFMIEAWFEDLNNMEQTQIALEGALIFVKEKLNQGGWLC